MKNKIAIYASNNIEENKEIIKILENLGGENKFLGRYTSESSCYYIREDNMIACSNIKYCYNHLIGYKLYTLNEYKKEFMENKEIKITPPEGYEIDKENSTFEKIVFKKVEEKLTYNNIIEKLFANKKFYYINQFGTIKESYVEKDFSMIDPNNAPTQHQLERLLAINKLMNVAYYLNDGWEPNWNDDFQGKAFIYYNYKSKTIMTDVAVYLNVGCVYFKSKKLAKQAVEILGEETIKLALGVI